jgi:2-C-methyl-D-erythritol 4-phosphate cytidylyltransferase
MTSSNGRDQLSAGAILVAAGSGRRFGERKQFRPLAGTPLYQFSLDILESHPRIAEIVLVVPDDALGDVTQAVHALNLNTPIQVVPGGKRRQDSVLAGIQALESAPYLVCIHDAARPFITTDLLERCLNACAKSQGAIAALPSRDTVKQAAADSRIISGTLPRETIWLAQTPQIFHRELLTPLLEKATTSDQTVTDEASLMEMAGYTVTVVEGSAMNQKITTQEDWDWAEAWLSRQRKHHDG